MNQPSIAFGYSFLGDGSSTSVSISFESGPVVFFLPSGGSAPSLNGNLSVASTSVSNVSCDESLTIESTTYLLGVLTVTFTTAPAAGTTYNVSGTLLYAG